jgi:hypothetical protein
MHAGLIMHAFSMLSFLAGCVSHDLPPEDTSVVHTRMRKMLRQEAPAAPPSVVARMAPAERAPVVEESAPAEAYGYPAERQRAPESAPAEEPRADRPGLGTVWGEARRSPVRDIPFERAAADPAAVATLYYNDRHGVSAMARFDARRGARFDVAVPVSGGLTVSIVDESGAPLEALALDGRIYVVGEAGRAYHIVVANHTAVRWESVISVDGLDVVNGQSASYEHRGYVIAPFGTITIDGFRRSHEEVAAFRFGSVAGSYAAQKGSDRDVGVIGVAFFGEAGPPVSRFATPPSSDLWSDDEIARRRSATPFRDEVSAE